MQSGNGEIRQDGAKMTVLYLVRYTDDILQPSPKLAVANEATCKAQDTDATGGKQSKYGNAGGSGL